VLIELEGEGVDLTLELGQSAGEPVALLAEGFRHRHHRFDELVFAVVDLWDVAHRRALRRKSRTRQQDGCRCGASYRTRTWCTLRVVGLTG